MKLRLEWSRPIPLRSLVRPSGARPTQSSRHVRGTVERRPAVGLLVNGDHHHGRVPGIARAGQVVVAQPEQQIRE